MRSRIGLRVLLTGIAFILNACTMSITAKVNPDGSGEVGFAYKLTEDDKNAFAGMGMSNMDDLCGQLSSQGNESLPGGLNLRQEKHGSETWCVASQKYGNLEELRTNLNGQGFAINTITIQDGKFVFDANADMGANASLSGDMPLAVGITFDLTTPGKVTKHNADEVKGNALVWNLPLGGQKNIHAESGIEGTGEFNLLNIIKSPWVILCFIGVCVLVLVVLLLREMTGGGSRGKKPPEIEETFLGERLQ